jgi:hypothetical protein
MEMIDDPGAETQNADLETEVAVQHQASPVPLCAGPPVAVSVCAPTKFPAKIPAIPAGRKMRPISHLGPSLCPTLAQNLGGKCSSRAGG